MSLYLLLGSILCLLIAWFLVRETNWIIYYRGRGDGWCACEKLVIERAKRRGIDIWKELLQ